MLLPPSLLLSDLVSPAIIIYFMIDSALPLIDLHRHIEGSVRLETILDLGREHNLTLPAWDVEKLRPSVQVTDTQPGVMAFIEKF